MLCEKSLFYTFLQTSRSFRISYQSQSILKPTKNQLRPDLVGKTMKIQTNLILLLTLTVLKSELDFIFLILGQGISLILKIQFKPSNYITLLRTTRQPKKKTTKGGYRISKHPKRTDYANDIDYSQYEGIIKVETY